MSSEVEAERLDCYLQLERGQRNGIDEAFWLESFLGCLQRAIKEADETLSGILHKAKAWERINLHLNSEWLRKILYKLMDGFEETTVSSKYAKLAKFSEDAALRPIHVLAEKGDELRNTTYSRLCNLEIRSVGVGWEARYSPSTSGSVPIRSILFRNEMAPLGSYPAARRRFTPS